MSRKHSSDPAAENQAALDNGQHVDPVGPDPGAVDFQGGSSRIVSTLVMPSTADIPGFNGLPLEVRERLLKARRDPTQDSPVKSTKQPSLVRIDKPKEDDIFRTYPDPQIGWFPVHLFKVKKAGNEKLYLVGEAALANRVVGQRARDGVAILAVTMEGHPFVWVLDRPDAIASPKGYPYHERKWQCATIARTEWVTIAWNEKAREHDWEIVRFKDDEPAPVPAWPAEHPLAAIDRAIQEIFVDDPDFEEFRNLVFRREATP
jgi:hypothetical protein